MADETKTGSEEDLLTLQHMETQLVRNICANEGILRREDEHRIRYAIGLASLETFQPGAAHHGRRTTRPDITVRSGRLSDWRRRVLQELGRPLRQPGPAAQQTAAAVRLLPPLLPELEATRSEILANHANDFSARELDQEIGIKTLVTIGGGGGGAGFGYIGAWAALEEAKLIPGYVIGSSIGAVIGLFRAARRRGDFAAHIDLAKNLRRHAEEIFRLGTLRARFGLPGILRLHLEAAIGSAFTRADGTGMELADLEIPFEVVVAGVRRGVLFDSPEEYAQAHRLPGRARLGSLRLRAEVGAQMVRMVAFINPRAVQEIVLGADALTERVRAVDAVGFSASVPGILHYDVDRDDEPTNSILQEVLQREDVLALVDGGVANNVPAKTAWRQVKRGKIGTRNGFLLAFDSFHPQYGLGHIWLQPVTRVIALQVSANDPYAHRRIEMKPTLSPLNLLPSPRELERAVGWGHDQLQRELPLIRRFLEPVPWIQPEADSLAVS